MNIIIRQCKRFILRTKYTWLWLMKHKGPEIQIPIVVMIVINLLGIAAGSIEYSLTFIEASNEQHSDMITLLKTFPYIQEPLRQYVVSDGMLSKSEYFEIQTLIKQKESELSNKKLLDQILKSQ